MNPAHDPLAVIASLLPGTPGLSGYLPAMALATVDGVGAPDVRTVLLSGLSDGLSFYTDSRTRKVTQIGANPFVALLLGLPERATQITIQGRAAVVDATADHLAYEARPRYLQLLAWLNTPEMAQLPESGRNLAWAEFDAAHPEGSLQPPAEWTGFLVVPHRVSIWTGSAVGTSHRVEYTRAPGAVPDQPDTAWLVEELPG